MNNQNSMAQLRYLEEVAINLRRNGFEIGRIEDQHLPVSWNGSYLCRISGKGSVLCRQEIVDALGAQAEPDQAVDIANITREYMTITLISNGMVKSEIISRVFRATTGTVSGTAFTMECGNRQFSVTAKRRSLMSMITPSRATGRKTPASSMHTASNTQSISRKAGNRPIHNPYHSRFIQSVPFAPSSPTDCSVGEIFFEISLRKTQKTGACDWDRG